MNHFKNMVWNYSRSFISEEDYYRMSRPKKFAFAFYALWGAAGFYFWNMKQANPETFYKKVVFSPAVVITMTIAPIVVAFTY